MTEEKRPVGRPTLYDPALCDKVIELGKLGKSVEQIASILGFSLRTFYIWRDAHEEFLHAMEDAKQYEQYWWEEQMQLAATGENPDANATLFIFNMKNRFHQDWKDNRQLDHTSSDRSMSPASASDASLLEIATGSK